VPAACVETLLAQQIAQHPAARERVVQMQLVQPSHQQQDSVRDRTRLVVRRAATDPQHLGLPLNREFVRSVDHLLALRSPAFVSAPSKKSFSNVNCPIFACSVFISAAASAGQRLRFPPEDAGRALQQLALPLRDLVRMHIELLCQIQHRLFP
jgi:hypothetical protein